MAISQRQNMEKWGNKEARQKYEARVEGRTSQTNDSAQTLEKWIRDKYEAVRVYIRGKEQEEERKRTESQGERAAASFRRLRRLGCRSPPQEREKGEKKEQKREKEKESAGGNDLLNFGSGTATALADSSNSGLSQSFAGMGVSVWTSVPTPTQYKRRTGVRMLVETLGIFKTQILLKAMLTKRLAFLRCTKPRRRSSPPR